MNVLIYAHRIDTTPDHATYAEWLTQVATGRQPFALSVLALAAFVRIVTNPRIFREPTDISTAWAFVEQLTVRPQARVVGPGSDHLAIFRDLCQAAGATGALVADAQHAAVAIEHGCTLITSDADFARFPELRWRHPLAPAT